MAFYADPYSGGAGLAQLAGMGMAGQVKAQEVKRARSLEDAERAHRERQMSLQEREFGLRERAQASDEQREIRRLEMEMHKLTNADAAAQMEAGSAIQEMIQKGRDLPAELQEPYFRSVDGLRKAYMGATKRELPELSVFDKDGKFTPLPPSADEQYKRSLVTNQVRDDFYKRVPLIEDPAQQRSEVETFNKMLPAGAPQFAVPEQVSRARNYGYTPDQLTKARPLIDQAIAGGAKDVNLYGVRRPLSDFTGANAQPVEEWKGLYKPNAEQAATIAKNEAQAAYWKKRPDLMAKQLEATEKWRAGKLDIDRWNAKTRQFSAESLAESRRLLLNLGYDKLDLEAFKFMNRPVNQMTKVEIAKEIARISQRSAPSIGIDPTTKQLVDVPGVAIADTESGKAYLTMLQGMQETAPEGKGGATGATYTPPQRPDYAGGGNGKSAVAAEFLGKPAFRVNGKDIPGCAHGVCTVLDRYGMRAPKSDNAAELERGFNKSNYWQKIDPADAGPMDVVFMAGSGGQNNPSGRHAAIVDGNGRAAATLEAGPVRDGGKFRRGSIPKNDPSVRVFRYVRTQDQAKPSAQAGAGQKIKLKSGRTLTVLN